MLKTKKLTLQQLAVNPASGGTVPIELPGINDLIFLILKNPIDPIYRY
jgi:hypothetical protein